MPICHLLISKNAIPPVCRVKLVIQKQYSDSYGIWIPIWTTHASWVNYAFLFNKIKSEILSGKYSNKVSKEQRVFL